MNIQHPITQTIKSRMAAVSSIDQLTYMNLSGIECAILPNAAKQLLEKCSNLFQLKLNSCGLLTLDNLPNLQLTIIDLGSNKLKDYELQKLRVYQSSIEIINLKKNKIQSLQSLFPFRVFCKLSQLNLKKNPLCQKAQNYSKQIFQQMQVFLFIEINRLPQNFKLTLIDFFKRNGEIMSDDEGDEDLDGPQWLLSGDIEEQDQDNDFDQEKSFSNQERKSNEQRSLAIKESTMLSIYEQYPKIDPANLVQYLNNNQLFKDPIQNCMDECLDACMEEDEKQLTMQGFKCKQQKKRKFEDQEY